MAHYAFLNDNNIVTEVIVGKDEDDNADLPEGFDSWEAWYADFRGQTCKRTSYNTMYFLVCYAGFLSLGLTLALQYD